jgi:hypothetical protein
MIEPDSVAGKAKVDPHGAVIMSFEVLGFHLLPTIRAGDRRNGINVGHEVPHYDAVVADSRSRNRAPHSAADYGTYGAAEVIRLVFLQKSIFVADRVIQLTARAR